MAITNTDLLLRIYYTMWLIRHFENKAADLFMKGILAKGGVHSSVGQEAVSTGVGLALRPDDWMSSTHRGHGHHLAKGADLRRLMAELLGKRDGYCRGRGGSMHVAAFEVGSLGAYAVVGEGVPIAVGAALAEKLKGSDRVSAPFLGDGALDQGVVHESFNLASVWKLPVVFVVERNGIAVSTDCDRMVAPSTRLADLARAYGLRYYGLDGQDVIAVHEAARQAVTDARAGQGPALLDCRTYRFEGHYAGEPQVYRRREEIDEMRRTKDPIEQFERYVLAHALATQEELAKVRQTSVQVVEEAAEFAQGSPEPDPETYAEYVYA